MEDKMIDQVNDEVRENAEKMMDTLRKKIEHLKSPDMDTEKILARIGIVSMFGGTTRTTVLGSAMFAGLYAPIVGLTKDQLIAAVLDAYDASAANPDTPKMAQKYSEANKEYQEKQKLQSDNPQAFVVPGNDKVH